METVLPVILHRLCRGPFFTQILLNNRLCNSLIILGQLNFSGKCSGQSSLMVGRNRRGFFFAPVASFSFVFFLFDPGNPSTRPAPTKTQTPVCSGTTGAHSGRKVTLVLLMGQSHLPKPLQNGQLYDSGGPRSTTRATNGAGFSSAVLREKLGRR